MNENFKDYKKPYAADFFSWNKFVAFCMTESIGAHPDDYGPWWECWKLGYRAALNA